jgi:hypothetical protein
MTVTRIYPLAISEFNARTKCAVCEIFIGIGHNDAVAFPAVDGSGYVCYSCRQHQLRLLRPGWRGVVWAE